MFDRSVENMWWGYLHQNGSIQVKRWWGDHQDYTTDCYGNEFVLRVVKPFQADNQNEAYRIIKAEIEAGGVVVGQDDHL